jgi:hypothetical protein
MNRLPPQARWRVLGFVLGAIGAALVWWLAGR